MVVVVVQSSISSILYPTLQDGIAVVVLVVVVLVDVHSPVGYITSMSMYVHSNG